MLTPYMVPFGRAVADGGYRRAVLACAAQSGKTEVFLDLIGHRMDQAPGPILYVGPNEKFLSEQFEPRLMELFEQAPTLRARLARGKRMKKTRKLIGGVPVRLAHAGSSTALKSDPAALALTDEADELMANVRGQGDPVGLVDARGDTYEDFVHAIVSTPSEGPSEVERDPESGLEFWSVQETDDLNSKVWALWQDGTRFHWAWPCPHCGEFFIPRFRCLDIPEGATPTRARREARLICPNNGCVIANDRKAEMNARGVYVAPGQRIEPDGTVVGDPPESETISFWVSGLCSPFRTWGDRAARYVTARRSGDPQALKTVINSQFGELYVSQAGEVPEWKEVERHAAPYYRTGEVPQPVRMLTAGIDVSGDRIYYVIRGWARRQESWLVKHGQLLGKTSEPAVWQDLEDLLASDFGGLHVKQALVDSGFRPDKPANLPVNRIYEFCRAHRRFVLPAKGYATRLVPLKRSRIDVNPDGGKSRYGLDLVVLDSDFFKSWVHQQVRPVADSPDLWHLPADIDEAYCRMIVSEARTKRPTGGYTWVPLTRVNHFLDCEALAYAAAYLWGIHKVDAALRSRPAAPKADRPGTEPPRAVASVPDDVVPAPAVPPTIAARRGRRVFRSSYV